MEKENWIFIAQTYVWKMCDCKEMKTKGLI